MATTTIGLKVDEALRERLRRAAARQGRTPHWLMKQALLAALDRIERGEEMYPDAEAPHDTGATFPFLGFAQAVQPQTVLRAKITASYRRPETECLPLLIAEAELPPGQKQATALLARQLVDALRSKHKHGVVDSLIHEFSLSSQEGVALMCLAEALLRIPDRPTRDALIRDKISAGDWQAHLGHSPSLFVNAATWGLLITGRLVGTTSESGLSAALTRLIGKGGEPIIRKGVDIAMRMMGEQFVTGQTIAEALANSRKWEAKGFRYSYDMLGEAALTRGDADRYFESYQRAIHAIGKAARKRGIYEGPGISIKLSALHPRYCRAQRERVMAELLPRLTALAIQARSYDIGLNIDAEEADRLELSLDLLESLCFHSDLAGWDGIGFVVQAYQKRAHPLLVYLIDLARRSGHRLMVRLVKGAYWDSEIKRAQLDGLEGFPVFTRKVHTDVSYLACARTMLAAHDAIFPQFATHNAQTLAAIHSMAGGNYHTGSYEFQCLHGMGEPLYEEVVGPERLNRPCRIYAPVGSHETLLAYLVRRLLENGANTSFVNRIADAGVKIEDLVEDPVDIARSLAPLGAPHGRIALPLDLFDAARPNSAGIDLSNEQRLASLSSALLRQAETLTRAIPLLADGDGSGPTSEIRNPADTRNLVGHVTEATPEQIDAAMAHADHFAPIWQATPPADRAATLFRAADLMEARMPALLGLIIREAGKTLPDAIGEIREAVDFLRYYGSQVRRGFSNDAHRPLGPIACISPWNFPLAIFTGQIAAALAAGNPVLAKPAEETPLIAAAGVSLLHEAGIPRFALQLLPGAGEVGARLVADARCRGVMFTGSTEVAKIIHQRLAERLDPDGRPIPLIAETGGQNALVVDSSALPEQVVADVLISAFDSAGQRCSALRVLCLQEEAADRIVTLLKGALAELTIGNPSQLASDVGPVITATARRTIEDHIAKMRDSGHDVHQLPLPEGTRHGFFVAPTLIEIGSIAELDREVFGPVLHILRYRRTGLDALIDDINATGYGLTFGVHSRIDETILRVTERVAAGNIYVNRNLIGAVVGVQPFGGHHLSGTGPKAGGPLYVRRLLSRCPPEIDLPQSAPTAEIPAWCNWLAAQGHGAAAHRLAASPHGKVGAMAEMPGPVGERNVYSLLPRGTVLCLAQSSFGLFIQIDAALATGNRALVSATAEILETLDGLPAGLREKILYTEDWRKSSFDAVLFEGDSDRLREVLRFVAARPGPIISVQAVSRDELETGIGQYSWELLVAERSVATNTAAAGGNATLMTIA